MVHWLMNDGHLPLAGTPFWVAYMRNYGCSRWVAVLSVDISVTSLLRGNYG